MSNQRPGKTITFTLDADRPLSADEQAMLARLAAMPDSDIDCSDIPSSPPDARWTCPGSLEAAIARAVRNSVCEPVDVINCLA
jgi:hypothetical protein